MLSAAARVKAEEQITCANTPAACSFHQRHKQTSAGFSLSLKKNSTSFKAQSESQHKDGAVCVLLWIFFQEDACQTGSISNMQVEQLCIHKTVQTTTLGAHAVICQPLKKSEQFDSSCLSSKHRRNTMWLTEQLKLSCYNVAPNNGPIFQLKRKVGRAQYASSPAFIILYGQT